MDLPLPWERLLWSQRAPLSPWERYALTDFRVMRVAGRHSDEIALEDIAEVRQTRSWIDRRLGTATLTVLARDDRRPPLVLPHVPRGVQLAALLSLAAAEPQLSWDAGSIAAVLSWEPRVRIAGYREAVFSVVALASVVLLIGISLRGNTPSVSYPIDDAIYPGGVKRDRASIERFMTSDVLPWAQQVLAPLKGGAAFVTCETCHGPRARAADLWRMPGVARLPQPDVAMRGWEVYGGGMDAQMRNAIYGYIAESDNQSRAAYMREVVMPGMARLLHRPAYDFTRSYEYNRTHFAFGCYHCHQVT